MITMADEQELTVPLRILVDREKRRVIFAEACKDFVDVLFSFLSLPMGTVISLLGNQSSIGCMNRLYKSVEDLSTENLCTDACKHMLLHPRNILATYCKNLKLNVDDTESIKHYICSDMKCSRRLGGWFSIYDDVRCSCGELLSREIVLKDPIDDDKVGKDGVFLKGSAMFIISDDLHIIPSSPGTMVKMLSKLGVRNVKDLDEQVLNIKIKQIADLLKHSVISKSPLTEVFLKNPKLTSTTTMIKPLLAFLSHDKSLTMANESNISNEASSSKMTIKVLLRKPDNKVMFAEARDDFVDLLFSFLTIPLGSMVKLLGGKSSLGCIDNLYKSVENLSAELFLQLKRDKLDVDIDIINTKDLLLNLGLAPQYGCKNQLLDIHEQRPPLYYCYSKPIGGGYLYYLTTKQCNVSCSRGELVAPLTLKDPKVPLGEKLSNNGFLKSPAMFIVLDNLEVLPSSVSSITFLKTLETPIDDMEECEISIGKEEALNLLRASLISTCALTNGLPSLSKKPNNGVHERPIFLTYKRKRRKSVKKQQLDKISSLGVRSRPIRLKKPNMRYR